MSAPSTARMRDENCFLILSISAINQSVIQNHSFSNFSEVRTKYSQVLCSDDLFKKVWYLLSLAVYCYLKVSGDYQNFPSTVSTVWKKPMLSTFCRVRLQRRQTALFLAIAKHFSFTYPKICKALFSQAGQSGVVQVPYNIRPGSINRKAFCRFLHTPTFLDYLSYFLRPFALKWTIPYCGLIFAYSSYLSSSE